MSLPLRSVPPLDILYFIAKELTVEQRSAYEHELLKEYYHLLPEHIRTTYVFDHGKKIRKTLHNDEWWFSVVDVCGVLTDSPDAKTKRYRVNRIL